MNPLKIGMMALLFLIAQNYVDAEESNKNIDLPLIHVHVHKHNDGQKDVEVKAPFVHVNNPAGPNNAKVKAPFTKVDHNARESIKEKSHSENTDNKSTQGTQSKQ